MLVLNIPCSLREHTGGRSRISLQATGTAEALVQLAGLFPACGERVLDGSGHPREWVRLLREGDQISIVPSVAGG